LLQPAVIGEASVVDARIRTENEFKLTSRHGFRLRETRGIELESDVDRLGCAALQKSIVEPFPPILLDSDCQFISAKPRAQVVVVRDSRFVAESAEDFTRRVRMVQRRDQRLNYAESAVERTSVAPRFKVVGFGDVPVAEFCGFVKM